MFKTREFYLHSVYHPVVHDGVDVDSHTVSNKQTKNIATSLQ